VITGVAFCPQAPLLVPEVASGAAAELDHLRAACRDAIAAVCAQRVPVLLGAADRATDGSRTHCPSALGSLAAFGVPVEVHLGSSGGGRVAELPLSLTVGGWLVRDALGPRCDVQGFSVGRQFRTSRALAQLMEAAAARDIALVVLGDGSARRSPTAPGSFDERAAGFDRNVAAALASGAASRLDELDAELGADLLASGVPAWHASAAALGTRRYEARVSYDDAPYGVGYFVACWTSK
jgi:hypothetical protein